MSSVRNTKHTTSSSPGQSITNCHISKIHNEVDSSPVSLKDKENIEPVPGQADNEMEMQSCIQTSNITSTTPRGKLVEGQSGSDIVNPLCVPVNAQDMNEIRNMKACSQNLLPDSDETTYTPASKTKESSEARLVPSLAKDDTPRQALLKHHHDDSKLSSRLGRVESGTPIKGTPASTETVSPSATLISSRHFSRHAPPRKKPLLRPVQGSDLIPETSGSVMQTEEIQSDSPGSLMGKLIQHCTYDFRN